MSFIWKNVLRQSQRDYLYHNGGHGWSTQRLYTLDAVLLFLNDLARTIQSVSFLFADGVKQDGSYEWVVLGRDIAKI